MANNRSKYVVASFVQRTTSAMLHAPRKRKATKKNGHSLST